MWTWKFIFSSECAESYCTKTILIRSLCFLSSRFFFFSHLNFSPIFSPAVTTFLDFCYRNIIRQRHCESTLSFSLPIRIIFSPVHWLLTNRKGSIQCEQLEMDELHFRKTLKKTTMVFRHVHISELLRLSVLLEKRCVLFSRHHWKRVCSISSSMWEVHTLNPPNDSHSFLNPRGRTFCPLW